MKKDENAPLRKRRRRPKVPRYYPLPVEGKFRMKGPPPPIPKFAYWGFHYYHPSIKVLILSVFLAFVSLTTPFWAYVDDSTFGLWMYCNYARCTSIHDNLVEGGSVPAWYHMTQGSFCIGTVACLVALGILVHNVYGRELKMTSTVYTAAVCVLGISVVQMTMALYTFTTYFEHTNFLYHVVDFEDQEIDFHGAFYCGLVSTVLNAVAAIIILLDDDITKAPKQNHNLMWTACGRLDQAQLQALYEQYYWEQYSHQLATASGEVGTHSGVAENDASVVARSWPPEYTCSNNGQLTETAVQDASHTDDSYSPVNYDPGQPPPYTEVYDNGPYFPDFYYDTNIKDTWNGADLPSDTILEQDLLSSPESGVVSKDVK